MIDVLWSQIGRPTASPGRAWCWGGVALLLMSLLPEILVGQARREAGANASALAGNIQGPTFSPSDQSLVAYSRQVEDTQELYLYDSDEKTVRQITAVEEMGSEEESNAGFFETDDDQSIRRFEGQLAWRPVLDDDGRQWFVFVSSAGGTGYGLFLSYLTPGGELSDRTVELPFQGQTAAPAWSPDGSRLVFSGSKDGSEGSELFMYSDLPRFSRIAEAEIPTDLSPIQLTQNPAGNLNPDWSPEGPRIVYQSKRTGENGQSNWGISLLDLSDWKHSQSDAPPRSIRLSWQLVDYHEYRPVWSPDGSYIGFYVSQQKVGASRSNRRLDIGVLKLVRGSGTSEVQTGQVLEGYTGRRLARDVLPNEGRGPSWNPLSESSGLIYVKKQENEGNPIYTANVPRWRSKNADFSWRLSTQFEDETRLHEEVSATRGSEGLRLAFVSQEGKSLRLQIRGPLRPTYGQAQAERDRAERDQRCRIQFAAKSENDRLMKNYKERINSSLESMSVEIIKINENKKEYKVVSVMASEGKKKLRKEIDKKIEGSKKFEKIKQGNPFPKCYQ